VEEELQELCQELLRVIAEDLWNLKKLQELQELLLLLLLLPE
jgi:hypothetical protein